MHKISDATSYVVEQDPMLRHGMAEGLLNLSQVARKIRSAVQARSKKQVSTTAITMALSRMQRAQFKASAKKSEVNFEVEHVTLHTRLTAFTYTLSPKLRQKLKSIQSMLIDEDGYFTITQSVSELTFVTEESKTDVFIRLLGSKPDYRTSGVAALGIKFAEKYLHTPGFLSALLREIALQGIDIIELASTATQLVIYIHESNVRVATDAILNRFTRSKLK